MSVAEGTSGQEPSKTESEAQRTALLQNAAAAREVTKLQAAAAVTQRHITISSRLSEAVQKLGDVMTDPSTPSDRLPQLTLLKAELEDVQVRLLFVVPK